MERASQLIREKIESRLTSGPDGLRRAFQFFDKDGSGSISLPEFDKALKEYIMLDLDEPTVRGCFERFGESKAPKPQKPKAQFRLLRHHHVMTCHFPSGEKLSVCLGHRR